MFSASLLLLASESSCPSTFACAPSCWRFFCFPCLLLLLAQNFAFFPRFRSRVRAHVADVCVCVRVETHVHMGFWIFVSPLVSPLVSCRSFREHVVLVFSAFLLLLASESSCPSLLRARRLAGVFSVFLAFCCCLLKILLSFLAFVRVFVPMRLQNAGDALEMA